jgi:integrating conjugative element protein (TIGR03749 family)
MRRVLSLLALATGTALCLAESADAVEILRWERLPLSTRLVVGQERVIFVDHNVRVAMPTSLREQLRVLSAGGALYLKASVPFPTTRLQLQDAESGALLLLDVRAESAAPGEPALEPLRIVGFAEKDRAVGTSDERPPNSPTPTAVVLTRYAAQSLYAPLRAVAPVAGLTAMPLRHDLPLDTLLPTLPVRATALAAWRLDEQWVTAIKLTNTAPRLLALDPRLLQGAFLAATFQHGELGPAGDSTDTTVLYLVTRGHGLAESLSPALPTIDASRNLKPEDAP